jgi:PilZ domain
MSAVIHLDFAAMGPTAGIDRVRCAEPCEVVSLDGYRRHGTIWNLSPGGVYAVLRWPLPPLGRTVLLTFTLPTDPRPVTCEARVEWHNPPSGLDGCGSTNVTLPPGCGLSFRVVDREDAARIAARVAASIHGGAAARPPV